MRLSFVILFLAASFAAHAQTAMPRMASVEPMNGKAGDVLVVTGENLTKDAVAKLYLTQGPDDLQVDITEQNATTIKFKIPAKAKAGTRYALMVLTGGKDAKLIEQPVKVTVDE
jgi:IPT/TIG domain